jgi:hypothetical protein
MIDNLICWYSCLKIPKWQSEAVNRRRTDNTMAERKRTNNNNIQNTTQKAKDQATRTPLKIRVNSGSYWPK